MAQIIPPQNGDRGPIFPNLPVTAYQFSHKHFTPLSINRINPQSTQFPQNGITTHAKHTRETKSPPALNARGFLRPFKCPFRDNGRGAFR